VRSEDHRGEKVKITPIILSALLVILVTSDLLGQEQSNAPTRSCDTESVNTRSAEERAYSAGKLLLETSLYRLHTRIEPGAECWCDGQVHVVMIFKKGEYQTVMDTPDYRKRFEQEILPVILPLCRWDYDIVVDHHVQGFFITQSGEIVKRENAADLLVQERFRSELLSSFRRYYNNRSVRGGRYQYFWTGDDVSIAAKQEKINAKLREKAEHEQYVAHRPQRYREKAAKVLQLLEKLDAQSAPGTYDFSSFTNGSVLQAIYNGNFEKFHGKYEQEDILEMTAAADVLGLRNFGLMRAPVMLAQSAYHNLFYKNCGSQTEIPFVVVRYRQSDIVTRNFFGVELSRIEGNTYTFNVRAPFASSFLNTYKGVDEAVGSGGEFIGITQKAYDTYKNDFDKFLQKEGCSAPVVRLFEVNLYLAAEWLWPWQKLVELKKQAAPPVSIENRVPASEQSATQPAAPKVKPKPRSRRP
jgi:hypothetical protein